MIVARDFLRAWAWHRPTRPSPGSSPRPATSNPDKITPESHAINDLGIDSLDFLDVAFAIDKAFGIKMPLEQWTQEVNDGKVSSDEYFVLGGSVRQYRQAGRGEGRLTAECGWNTSRWSTGSPCLIRRRG